jgi:hypothetical protein
MQMATGVRAEAAFCPCVQSSGRHVRRSFSSNRNTETIGRLSAALFRSDDGGENWQKVSVITDDPR